MRRQARDRVSRSLSRRGLDARRVGTVPAQGKARLLPHTCRGRTAFDWFRHGQLPERHRREYREVVAAFDALAKVAAPALVGKPTSGTASELLLAAYLLLGMADAAAGGGRAEALKDAHSVREAPVKPD